MRDSGREHEQSLMKDFGAPPPAIVLKVIFALSSFLNFLLNAITPPAIRALNKGGSFMPNAWLCTAARFGVADALKDGPLTAPQLASKLGVRAPELYRGLRLLVTQGYFEAIPAKNSEDTLFRNNSSSAVLRKDHPNSVKQALVHWHNDAYSCFGPEAMDWVLTCEGKEEDLPTVYKHIHGIGIWDHYAKNQKDAEVFNDAMVNVDSLTIHGIIADFKWGAYRRVIDIGGALGSVLSVVMQNNQGCEGVLFDQPRVIEDAKKFWKEKPAGLQSRTTFAGGDFFDSATIPKGRDGDLYFLRNIIHDWPDKECIDILRALRKAIGSAKVTLALIELALIPEWRGFPLNLPPVTDNLMMNLLRGKERTQQQFEDLFEASGFKLAKCQPTHSSPMWFILATPV